jgi:lysophospholipase L1-like esterase
MHGLSRFGPSRRHFLTGAGAAGAGAVGLASAPATRARASGGTVSSPPPSPVAAISTQQSRSLTPWFAGLSNRMSANCNVVCLGDSITEGEHASGPPFSGFENRWVARLRDMLRARYPTQGLTGGGRGFIGAVSTGETSFTWPTTLAGSPSTAITGGPKSKFVQLGASGQSVTFTLIGDSADIMWMQAPLGGTFSWAVDGGSASKISTSGASTADGKITHISLGPRGTHTLVLSWVSGKSNVAGVIEYNGDHGQGIGVLDAGHYGWQTSSWVNALNNGAASGPAAAIAALAPSAVVITLGVNDQYSGVIPATFQSRLQTIIADLQARLATPYPAFVLNMLPPRVNQASYTYPWDQYVTAAYNVAAADASGPGGTSIVTVMDFTTIPSIPGADTDAYGFWQAGDLVHPSNRGHQMIADCLTALLSFS